MQKEKLMKILIINLGGIGDILLSTPALRALRSLYPKAQISILITPRMYNIVKNLFYIDKYYIFNMEPEGITSFFNFFSNIKILFILRKECFDLAVNMRTLVSEKGAKNVKLLLDIINPKIKVGRDTEGRGYFYDIKIPETEKEQKYEMEYDLDTVRTLGAEINNKCIDYNIKNEDNEKISKILEGEAIFKETILIGIHPGGKSSHRWPLKNYLKAIEDIYKTLPCKFVITGDKKEIKLAQKIKMASGAPIINLAGKLNLFEIGALIKRCNLFISNDTGPMHIAAILRTPLIAIFGPGYLTRFDPRNISHRVMVSYKNADCAPCDKVKCRSLKCLKLIPIEEIVKNAIQLANKEI